jgi:hypothetical protein
MGSTAAMTGAEAEPLWRFNRAACGSPFRVSTLIGRHFEHRGNTK